MKNLLKLITCTNLILSVASASVQAATVSFSDPVPNNGISYEWSVRMSDTDSAILTNHVGAKSWNEPLNPVGLKGWTHTSNWVALELLEDSAVTLEIDRASSVPLPLPTGGFAGNSLIPAFSLYKGWQDNGLEDHQYNNSGQTPWANEIHFLDNNSNSSSAISITQTFILSAGKYSIAIGGNPPDPNAPTAIGRQGYTATLNTTAATVPEPSTNGFIATFAALMLLSFYRKSRP